MKKAEIIEDAIANLKKNMKALIELLKNGETNNPKNLTVPILMQRCSLYLDTACNHLEDLMSEL